MTLEECKKLSMSKHELIKQIKQLDNKKFKKVKLNNVLKL